MGAFPEKVNADLLICRREEDEDQMMSSPLPPPKRQAAISATVTSGALQLLHGQAASPLGALPVEESLEAEEITPHPKWGQVSKLI